MRPETQFTLTSCYNFLRKWFHKPVPVLLQQLEEQLLRDAIDTVHLIFPGFWQLQFPRWLFLIAFVKIIRMIAISGIIINNEISFSKM